MKIGSLNQLAIAAYVCLSLSACNNSSAPAPNAIAKTLVISPTSSNDVKSAANPSNTTQIPIGPVSPWQNAYKDPNGTLWSDILPGTYADCISEKDSDGKIRTIIDEPNRVACQATYDTFLDNYVNDGVNLESQTVYASDAIDACKLIGGTLPSDLDYLFLRNLGDEYLKVPNIQSTDVWTTSSDPNQVGNSFLVSFSSTAPDGDGFYEHERSSSQDSSIMSSVRCIKR
jgi:hypothetical protein